MSFGIRSSVVFLLMVFPQCLAVFVLEFQHDNKFEFFDLIQLIILGRVPRGVCRWRVQLSVRPPLFQPTGAHHQVSHVRQAQDLQAGPQDPSGGQEDCQEVALNIGPVLWSKF